MISDIIDNLDKKEEEVKNDCSCKPMILIVDDNIFNILPVKTMIIDNYNIEVDEACNGEVAVQMFQEKFDLSCGCINRTYRLILMDIQMPVMDGYESSTNIIKIIREKYGSESSISVNLK